MAKPSIRICKASISDWPRQQGFLLWRTRNRRRMLPGGTREHDDRSVRGDLDEARELEIALGDLLRPDRDLLAALPLQHQSGDQALAVLDRMGERVVLAVELDASDGAFPVGLLQRIDHLIGLDRAGTLHRIRDVIDLVIGGVARIGRIVAEALLEILRE